MKAFVLNKYGSSKNLKIQEIEKPTPKANEVLVKIHATSINDYDWCILRGKPYLYRLLFGILKPRNSIPGMEFSGVIQAVGENVSEFQVGDSVYGDISDYGFGTFAQYACVHKKAISHKPEFISFEEATAIPHASMLALQGLRLGEIENKKNILINGAGGGVGTLALQLAKIANPKVKVSGVDTGDKLKLMKDIGFDRVIDYKKEDFTKGQQKFDLIIDAKLSLSILSYIKVLEPKASCIVIGGNVSRLLQLLFLKIWILLFSNKKISFLTLRANKDLEYVHTLFKEKKLTCIIDGPFEFEQIPYCLDYFGSGKHMGKIVISLV